MSTFTPPLSTYPLARPTLTAERAHRLLGARQGAALLAKQLHTECGRRGGEGCRSAHVRTLEGR